MVEPATTANAGPLSKHSWTQVSNRYKTMVILRRRKKIKCFLCLLSGLRMYSYLCIPILRLRRELGLWGTLIMIIFMLVALYSEPERRPPLQAGQGPSVQSQRHDNRLHKTLTKKQWSQQLSDFVRETSLTTSSNYKQEWSENFELCQSF